MTLHFNSALVTGGAGFIGSHLVDSLVSEGCRVTVLDDLSTGSLENIAHHDNRINFFQGDVRDRNLLDRTMADVDVVFHEAAVVSVVQTVENPVESALINELGTLHVLESARKNKVRRVVLASSAAVYGDDAAVPNDEAMKPEPKSPYAVQKLAGELYAQVCFDLYGLETVCLRYFNVYGPRQDPFSPYSGVISIFMNTVLSRSRPVIYGDGEQFRDFVFVADVVQANLKASQAPGVCGGLYNVGTGKHVTIRRLWETISQLTGYEANPEYLPQRPGDIIQSVSVIDRASSGFGFRPEYTFEKGLEETYRWYRRNEEQRGRP